MTRRQSAALLGAVLVLLAVAVVLILAHRAPRLAATNSRVTVSGADVIIAGHTERCQGGEYLPAEADRMRVLVDGFLPGPPESLSFRLRSQDGRSLANARAVVAERGHLQLPLPPRRAEAPQASLCIHNEGDRKLGLTGNRTPANPEAAPGTNGRGERVSDEVRVDYLRPGSESWFSILEPISQRFTRFKPGWVGAWTLWALAAVAVAAAAAGGLVLRSVLRRPRQVGRTARIPGLRRVPMAALACAGLALVNAAMWNVITPTMQGPDEIGHISYVEYVAQHGKPPSLTAPAGGRGAEGAPILGANWTDVVSSIAFSPEGPPIWSPLEDRDLRARLATDATKQATAVSYVAVNPPLYYAVDAAVDRALHSQSPLDRLFWMRLLGAVLAAATVILTFLFLRELMPGSPWTWTVGGLGVAFQPDLGFLGGVVSPDTALFAASAALLLVVARSLRLGLTVRRGVALGLIALAGALTKGTFFALAPGTALGVAVMLWRARARRRPVLVAGGVAAAAAGVPFAIWQRLNTAVLGRGSSTTSGVTDSHFAATASVRGQLSYLWQTFLPALGGQHHWFVISSRYPLWDIYLQGFIGRFGWFAFGLPKWADWIGLVVIISALLAAAVALGQAGAWRRRTGELATYAAMLGGTVLLVAFVGYRFKLATTFDFEQARYLLGLLPLWGAVLACATRPFGRWMPLAASVLVGACILDSLASQMVSVGDWYAFYPA